MSRTAYATPTQRDALDKALLCARNARRREDMIADLLDRDNSPDEATLRCIEVFVAESRADLDSLAVIGKALRRVQALRRTGQLP